ncbi:DUF2000 domain-containing protein [Streptantibioticus silvisoli]|uniref:DUF2000 domain-containing protein n=1 Tax=Streptantibioticus silvisoli TaxID=2705255 RepID=A0ABT6VT54_9ACTN|nr:DUF2000 domain-containing protein [Streptantibioticus silvisoli]MDI5961666.1 DUF2000 domain-containing protein [Streptantibioticus silvisoli]
MESSSSDTTRTPGVGFAPDEVITDQPTRSARLKWVIVVDRTVPAGQLANAVACVAASTGQAVANLIGPAGPDAAGHLHPGLPWAGCSVLAADPGELAEVREKAAASDGVLVADMPVLAQRTLVYDDYLAGLAGTGAADLQVRAISVVGPRNKVGKLVKRLELLP